MAIEAVSPEVDGGRFAVKRTLGDLVLVDADIFADGHDELAAVLRYRAEQGEWREAPLRLTVNDSWRGQFRVDRLGRWSFTIEAWVDHFHTWARDMIRRLEAGQDVEVDLKVGAALVRAAAKRASGADAKTLAAAARSLTGKRGAERALASDLANLMARHPDRSHAGCYGHEVPMFVERERARFSAWYEMFPRSASSKPGRHGTFKDVEARLPYVAGMGFDVLYLPPIHPIGAAFRKGANNTTRPTPSDPGSPWAIGAPEGGHKSIHPELGTLADFRHLVAAAERHGLEVALDIAFQVSPDHPYVRDHPEWFRQRPDGTIQYAENPPKKYQDIYPFDFQSEHRQALWEELKSVFEFWVEQGVRAFRVDNPHTKPFDFWEWVIGELHDRHPDLIFLSEAFTHPKVMYRLAKLGFSQSYTYFAWRHEAWELKQYFSELTRPPVSDFFRANLWPNTPDILTDFAQKGGPVGSALRLVLAATLGASFGIYGPVYELVETSPHMVGREDYLDSEKYAIRHWDLKQKGSLRELITRVNRIRREHPALQHDRWLRFVNTDNERLLAYTKTAPDGSDPICVVVNLDPFQRQAGWIELPVESGPLTYAVEDVLNGAGYTWNAPPAWNYVDLDPAVTPAHVFRIGRRLRELENSDVG